MGRKVNVLGVGMVKFLKPGASDGYEVMANGAIREALKDAGVDFKELEQAYAGYVFGNIPWVKDNLSLIVVGIVVVSLIPAVITFVQERRAKSRS